MSTFTWFATAVPAPARKNFHVQLGVHFEEVKEQLDTIKLDAAGEEVLGNAKAAMGALAAMLKKGNTQIEAVDWHDFFDAIVDQRVTGTGLAYMIGADLPGAITEVDSSNESKFVDGKPIWDENGKIAKGPNYRKANLLPYLPATTTIAILDK